MCRPSFGHFSALIVHKILRKNSNETSIHDCVTSPKTKRNSDVATVENRKSRQNYKLPRSRKIFTTFCTPHRFANNSILQTHRRGVHENSNVHMCEVCAKTFKSKLYFEQHRLEHKAEKRPKVQCDICKVW